MAQPYAPPCERSVIDAEPCPEAAGRAPPRAKRRWILAACILASSSAFIDGSALTVALPTLRRDLGAGLEALQWVINGYVLALAALTMVGGAMADIYGKARMVQIGCAGFAAASLACALSPDVGWLIAARIAQGAAAAIMTPATLALIGATYPKAERNAAIGAWAAASALTTMAGPVLGGWLTETFGWPAIFLINLPIAALAAIILVFARPQDAPSPRRFDWVGAALLAASLAAAAYALGRYSDGAGGLATFAAVAVSASGLVAFAAWERTAADPMAPPAIFANRPFTTLNVATFLLYAALSLMFFLLPFELIERRDLSATEAGLVFLPFSAALGLLSQVFGKAADKTGEQALIAAGGTGAAAAYAWMASASEAGLVLGIVAPMGLLGLSFALLVAPLTASVMSSVDEADEGLASGVNNTASRIAQLAGVAVAAMAVGRVGGYEAGLAGAAFASFAGGMIVLFGPRSRAPQLSAA